MVQTCYGHAIDMVQTCYRYGTDMLQTCYRYGTDIVQTWSQHAQTCYRYGTDMLQTCYRHGTDMVKTYYRHGTDMVRTWYRHTTDESESKNWPFWVFKTATYISRSVRDDRSASRYWLSSFTFNQIKKMHLKNLIKWALFWSTSFRNNVISIRLELIWVILISWSSNFFLFQCS